MKIEPFFDQYYTRSTTQSRFIYAHASQCRTQTTMAEGLPNNNIQLSYPFRFVTALIEVVATTAKLKLGERIPMNTLNALNLDEFDDIVLLLEKNGYGCSRGNVRGHEIDMFVTKLQNPWNSVPNRGLRRKYQRLHSNTNSHLILVDTKRATPFPSKIAAFIWAKANLLYTQKRWTIKKIKPFHRCPSRPRKRKISR